MKYIISIFLIIQLIGCKPPASPEELKAEQAGKWILEYSLFPDSSDYIQKEKIILNKDGSLSCTSSFFWRSDSLKLQPLVGNYEITSYTYNSGHDTRFYIEITVNSTERNWGLVGGNADGYMQWCVGSDMTLVYRWKLIEKY